MNELGGYSQREHKMIGEHCDPRELSLVVTIGPDANKFLAPAAAGNGCEVKTFNNPYDAGEYVKPIVEPGAVILVKGSQNKVFAEEAAKILLADPKDSSKLVRQTPYWMKMKKASFKK
jgi:UDP-N-acetylmuramoyl-tripeptide--D-alanyl-D-alanine ligase